MPSRLARPPPPQLTKCAWIWTSSRWRLVRCALSASVSWGDSASTLGGTCACHRDSKARAFPSSKAARIASRALSARSRAAGAIGPPKKGAYRTHPRSETRQSAVCELGGGSQRWNRCPATSLTHVLKIEAPQPVLDQRPHGLLQGGRRIRVSVGDVEAQPQEEVAHVIALAKEELVAVGATP